jgi:hypothetical protein
MVHLRILDAVLREPGPLELPNEMIATVFKNVEHDDVIVWVLEIVEDRPS